MARAGRRDRKRAEPRLDPVRWRRPGPGLLIRLSAVAALLATASAVAWWQPPTCAPAPDAAPPRRRTPGPATAVSTTPSGDGAVAPARIRASGVPSGSVGVPVRLAEPTALTLVHPGDRVDLLRMDDAGGGTPAVAAAALVLGVTGANDP